jgi:hypothetical protein
LGGRTVDEHGVFIEFREKIIIVEIIVDVRQQRKDDDDDEEITFISQTTKV